MRKNRKTPGSKIIITLLEVYSRSWSSLLLTSLAIAATLILVQAGIAEFVFYLMAVAGSLLVFHIHREKGERIGADFHSGPQKASRTEDQIRLSIVREAYADFKTAIDTINGSKLPQEVIDLARKIRERAALVEKNGGFHTSIKSQVAELIQRDLPALVKDYQKLELIATGSIRQEGKDTFIAAFMQIAKRFDEIMEIQAREAADNIATRANYIRAMHVTREDSPLDP